ncbi:T9SS type A sorting domain-containing protein [Flavobacterium gawalongense]|uniref:T9SS type A sorting domain-containing protein n=1 Tax=Flavobacterium gawalongense TaxID=2594432 RepID=A0A553BTW6_9FLAO|nr:T9SS type A sorting domain-containing protein [Flavobacterium gawalongense]TRX02281.1 T9SS type A sorting domain-containing protein [Flavobacterium gawalongense]TRX07509.1 T9SS type A sorting domain-containing protein [Flavobacterium gawalongense]TRX11682.1 T9SS type A sorting domain-containing protein [Flavobacterium gawalongense]TRX12452.1 T9SS type A sorting domain-containing protein [Flavobacterium gawalongense]TRX30420.1 T9SS type A sorting domain-containing protein [Flavobacterium gaw
MKKGVLCFLLLLFIQMGFAQSNLLWQGYFSYNEIKDVSESTTAVFVASENALFSKNITTSQIKTTNTIDGLSGQTISASYHSATFNKTIVGYENGLIIVINEADGSMLNVVDIINKQLPSNIKKINHFTEFEGIIYVSCDFGIVQFNLATMQFGDTYFIGTNGAEIIVNQTALFNGFIYAATNSGIKRATIFNENLIDYSQWETIAPGNWSSVEIFGADLFAVNAVGYIHKYNESTSSFTGYLALNQPSSDMRATVNYLIVTTLNSVYIYNSQMGLVRQITTNQITESNPSFTCATIIGDTIFIGTKEDGLITTSLSSVGTFENTTPIGPSRNNIFALQTTSNSLWTVYGDYTVDYNPYDLDSYGVSKFSATGWLNIPYEKVFGAKSMTRITVNPSNENDVYASSFFSGLLKIENDEPTFLYNQTNSGLESLTFAGPNYIDVRINGAAFDKSGNFWVTNSRIKNGLKVLKSDGQWQSYAMDNILDSAIDNNFGTIAIDKNGTKWLSTSSDGVIGFNESGNKFKKITTGPDTGNLPIADVRTVAVDTRDQLWIGTTKGLRVLSNVGSFQSDNQLTTNPIIILEDNLAQELLYEQFITDIAVDGANNKWIGTADSGVFLVSPNGQETKYHFTINNSPLPSNDINDIDINSTTGEVFIATAKGLVSFKGVSTAANDDLSNAYVYPNPVRPEYQGTVKIAGLLDKANIKITDIEGNLVYETTSEGGTIEWDTTAFGKHKVASGVYMIFISAQDGVETKVKKVMIIR